MTRNRKRTKQTLEMIEVANQVLKNDMVNFENKYDSSVFMVTQHLLLRTSLYQGFNMYYEKDGRNILVGTSDIPIEKQFIQFC